MTKVLVVDDSSLVRGILQAAIHTEPDLQVVGMALVLLVGPSFALFGAPCT